MLINTYLSGQTVFRNTIGGNNFEYGYALQPTPDDGGIIGGVKNSNFIPSANNSIIVKAE